MTLFGLVYYSLTTWEDDGQAPKSCGTHAATCLEYRQNKAMQWGVLGSILRKTGDEEGMPGKRRGRLMTTCGGHCCAWNGAGWH